VNKFWGWLVAAGAAGAAVAEAAAAAAAAAAPVAAVGAVVEAGVAAGAAARAGGAATSCLRWSGIPYRRREKGLVQITDYSLKEVRSCRYNHIQSSSIRRLCQGC
jgi:hypothetical protein